MEKAIIEGLADMVIQQYGEMPLAIDRKVLDRNKLIGILGKATGFDSEKRMQFEIPYNKHEEEAFSDINSQGLIIRTAYPRRIFANYDTNYKPSKVVGWRQKSEEEDFENGTASEKSYSQVCCRKMRHDPVVAEIRARSLAAGNKFGVMLKLSGELPTIDGRPYYSGDQHFVLPLFFIPGSSKEDLDALAKFSITLQNPDQKKIANFVTNYVFERRLYE